MGHFSVLGNGLNSTDKDFADLETFGLGIPVFPAPGR